MTTIDYGIIVIYLAVLVVVGIFRRSSSHESAAGYILGGRKLTLPAFVATLVSTWYGGILGVGEYSYLYGISNWLVFGLPYYLAAILFAVFLAKRARRSEVLTIPDQLYNAYGRGASVAGSIILFLMTIPGAYVLMLAVLGNIVFGWPLWLGAILGVLFSVFYVHLGGFRSVVRTDLLQFGLMFLGFAILLIVLINRYGGFEFVSAGLPDQHLTWHGGNSEWYIATWYFIALATLIEPSFYQRCYAAKNARTARNGIFVSIIFWIIFDFMTTSCGLYARVLLPDLAEPIGSYPALAQAVLPPGLLGLFILALLATIMSTVDSYSFLAASTFGRDIVWRLFKIPDDRITYFTRIGLILSALIALCMALFFESVIDIWHDYGSVATPALLIPVFFAFVGKRKLKAGMALICIVLSGLLSLCWLIIGKSTGGGYFLGIAPVFPGFVFSLIFYLAASTRKRIEISKSR